jgi:hypothetical protein
VFVSHQSLEGSATHRYCLFGVLTGSPTGHFQDHTRLDLFSPCTQPLLDNINIREFMTASNMYSVSSSKATGIAISQWYIHSVIYVLHRNVNRLTTSFSNE